MNRTKGLLAALLLVSVVLWGFVPAAQADKVLRIAYDAGDMTGLNPHFTGGTQDRGAVVLFFSGLVRYKPGDITQFLPDVAERWEKSADGLNWTFHLRKGVMVHPWNDNPGYELTSEDVVFSLKNAANPSTSAFAAEYDGMTFTAPDKYTVVITLSRPQSEALFLPKVADYSGGMIVPKKPYEDLGESFRAHPVGTGPFVFKEYFPKEKVVAVRNAKFYRTPSKLDGVEIYYMPDVSSRKFGLMSGELDVIEGPPSQPWVDEMRSLPGVAVDIFGPGEQGVLHFNMTQKPFDDIRVRKAFMYAINREEVVATIGPSIAIASYSHPQNPQGGWMSAEQLAEQGRKDGKDYLYKTNAAKAKALLAEAGYGDGLTVEWYQTERGEYMVPMQNIQAQLRRVGINAKFNMIDHTTWHHHIRADMTPVALYNCIRPNSDVRLTHFHHSSSEVVKGDQPITNFSHVGTVDADGDGKIDSVDDLIEAARKELDPAKQAALWSEASLRLLDWGSSMPLFIKRWTFARRENVSWGYDLQTVIHNSPVFNELMTKTD